MIKFMTTKERQQVVDAMPRSQLVLPPACIDEAANGRISFEQLSKGLTVRIPFFEGQQVGVRLHVLVSTEDPLSGWGMGGVILSADEDTLLSIPADRSLAFRGQNMELQYFYFGVDDPTAPTTSYFAEDTIYRPIIDEARGNVIPLDSVNGGATLRLRAADVLTPDALVTVYMHATDCEASLVLHFRLSTVDAGKDVLLTIGPDYLRPNKYGDVRFVYTVENSGQRWISPIVEFNVEGDLQALRPVYGRPGYSVPGTLELTDEGGRIPFVLGTRGLAAGDVVTFIFAGDSPGAIYILRQTLAPHQIGQDLKILVPLRFNQLGAEPKAMSIAERSGGEIVSTPLLRMTVPHLS